MIPISISYFHRFEHSLTVSRETFLRVLPSNKKYFIEKNKKRLQRYFLHYIYSGMELTKREIFRLKEFELLLLKWQKGVNLVSANSASDIWQRHIMDSCQLFPYVKEHDILDLGSGGGFPGLVLAILNDKKHKIYLVERDTRKCAFLREVARQFDLNTIIINESVEKIKTFPIEIITARAFADIEKILTLSEKFITKDTILYLLKGRSVEKEIEKALSVFHFDVERIPSETSTDGIILEITNVIKKT